MKHSEKERERLYRYAQMDLFNCLDIVETLIDRYMSYDWENTVYEALLTILHDHRQHLFSELRKTIEEMISECGDEAEE